MYTDSPGPIDNGPNPARDEVYRAGIWDDTSLQDLSEMQGLDGSSSSYPESYTAAFPGGQPGNGMTINAGGGGGATAITGGTTGTTTTGTTSTTSSSGTTGGTTGGSTAGDARAGGFPWENWGPGGGTPNAAGAVNTNTGDRLTSVPVVSWPTRGGNEIDFTLYHNSAGKGALGWGQNWRSSYDVTVFQDGGYQALLGRPTTYPLTAILTWGDGTSVVFKRSSGTTGPYTSPAGVYDRLASVTGGWTLTTKDQTLYSFDNFGYLLTISDRNGNVTTVSRDATTHMMRSIMDPSGRVLTLSSSGSPARYTGLTDPASRSWSFSLNGSNQMTGLTYPYLSGQRYARSFSYDTGNDITSETDLRGKAWACAYDSSHRLISFADPLANSVAYTYGSSSTSYSLPAGGSETHRYNAGVYLGETDPAGYSDTSASDGSHNVVSYTTKRGIIWTFAYDANGNQTSALFNGGGGLPGSAIATTYNAFNDVTGYTTGEGTVHVVTVDARGNPTRDDISYQSTNYLDWVRTYDSYGNETSYSGPDGTFSYTPDSYGDVVTVLDGNNKPTSIAHDILSRPTSVTDPLNHSRSFTYDEWGRLVTLTNPDNSTQTALYDLEDDLTTAHDELGHTNSFGYDDAMRLTSHADGLSRTENYGYNGNGWLTSVTNARGYVRSCLYTPRGELWKSVLADGETEYSSFDAMGNQTRRTNALAQDINYGYDAMDRLSTVSYPSGVGTSFTYHGWYLPDTMIDASGTTSWTYEFHEMPHTLTTPAGTLTYGYTGWDRTSMSDSSGTRTYAYDNCKRLAGLTGPVSGAGASWTYDDAGRVSRQTFGNGCYTDYTFDSSDRLTGLTHKNASGQVLGSESYGFDVASRLCSRTALGALTQYTYDSADELLTESRPGYSASYTYDANGNRLSRVVNGLTDSFTYDPADKILSAVSGGVSQAYGYDGAGRMTSLRNGQIELQYDYDDRVASITSNGSYTSYTYNGLGSRVAVGTQKIRRDGAGVTSDLLSDGSFDYNQGISRSFGSTVTSTHTDMLGSIKLETNSSGSVTSTRSYDAFGNLASGSQTGLLGYAGAWGYEEDPGGLKLLGHRWYDSASGRFLTRDPAQDGRNWYDYTQDQPTGEVDPEGLQAFIFAGSGRFRGRPSIQVPPAPPGVSVRDNIERMHRIQARSGSSGISFAILVREGGEWDYKRRGRKYEDFGNFNFGAVAAAMGYDQETACRMAGAVQKATGTSKPQWGSPWDREGPYGDDPHDQHEIKLGYRYYNEVVLRK